MYFSVYYPFGIDISKPETAGIRGARNFYLVTNEKVKIGTWYVIRIEVKICLVDINDDGPFANYLQVQRAIWSQ